ncbi:AFL056Cp [Eremothecium gossypii ATCC 10895]|uniref:AFL056Cp n=1 Tax=Eremothecium gossypii (strain ATCC 10895 / CBS 109.51 / FGSC 9923 / NRRL Y-1056) TaxID=284811 RepID=Q754X2_EREGS|nr:AFL056Cp [Eremothecium gossypii ATCC 10895]AAS53316.1 AFL056Cp [Eremothecium gossypii ATCC 10895]AEY97627.1 FAFL056Cp [Eremothecium gossypii FDAG1]
MNMSLDKVNDIAPCTAVRILGDGRCLAGCGPEIYVYEYRGGVLLNRCRVFQRNKVHGICVQDGWVIAYGDRSVSILELEDVMTRRNLKYHEYMTPEWVLGAAFSADGRSCYLLTCYNSVLEMDLEMRVVRSINAGERSLLYSGSVKVVGDAVYVCAGTVMGGVVVWELHTGAVVQRLEGHEGSIFCAVVSDDGRLVASCSDDRSIRVWSLETGEQVGIAWGHTARIWDLRFLRVADKLVSVSEDCTCRVWAVGAERMQEEAVYDVHQTKSVWAVDVQEDDMVAVTAGNDGRLRLVDLTRPGSRERPAIDLTTEGLYNMDHTTFKGFCWFERGPIAITSCGKILQRRMLGRWECILADQRLAGYSVTRRERALGLAVIANASADVLVLRVDTHEPLASKWHRVPEIGKCTNILVTRSGEDLLILAESPQPSDPLVCLRLESQTLAMKAQYVFRKPAEFSTRALGVYEHYIIVGSRFSTVAVFDLDDPSYEFVLRKLLPGDTITAITHISGHLFAITDRDGHYNFVCFDFAKRAHRVVHSNKVQKGFLEGIIRNAKGDYITYGFKADSFYMYNETKQYEIGTVLCGGANRQWDLVHRIDDSFLLCYIKAGDPYVCLVRDFPFSRVLGNGLHGREIRDISIRSDEPYKNGYLFITGSEDTNIKLNCFDVDTGEIRTFWTLKEHVSGLQRCEFINKRLFVSCSAREELFLWQVTDTFDIPYVHLLQKLPVSSSNPDLRIMDFSCKFVNGTENFVIATVCSDSSIRLWYYDSEKNAFTLLVNGFYTQCCILNAELIVLQGRLYLLVSATDGHLVVWDMAPVMPFAVEDQLQQLEGAAMAETKLPEPSVLLKVHQSGVKALGVSVRKSEFVVYSGGDDNALAISIFSCSNDSALVAKIAAFNPSAATSTITSLSVVSEGSYILTSSIDQILRVWSVARDQLQLHSQSYTTVADTGPTAVVASPSGTWALAGGAGLTLRRLLP